MYATLQPTASSEPNRNSALPTLWHRPNWRGARVKLPHYFVRGMGGAIEDVVTHFRAALHRRYGSSLSLAWAGESTNQPGTARPLRVIRAIKSGHSAACDVNLYAQGGDLYVRFECRPRTRIVYLQWALYTSIFLGLFAVGCLLLFNTTEQWSAMARAYATELQVDGNGAVLLNAMLNGDPTLAGRPWGWHDFVQTNPVLFITSLGRIPFFLAAVSGGALLLIPKDWINYPCKQLEFPLPDAFSSMVLEHNAQIEDVLSEMFASVYRVYRDQMIQVQDA